MYGPIALFTTASLFAQISGDSTAPGQTTIVPTGSDALANGVALASAISAAACGDTLVLQAGATYRSPDSPDNPIAIPNKSCRSGSWVTIRSSLYKSLPAKTRVSPGQEPLMAILDTPREWPVIRFVAGASWYHFLGIVFTTAPTQFALGRIGNALVEMLDTGKPDEARYIWFDRCVFRPYEALTGALNRTVQQGIAIYGAEVWVTECYFYGFGGQQNSVPIPITAVASGGAAVANTLTITDTSGTTAVRPFSISRVFAQGERGGGGQFAQAVVNSSPVATQCDVKSRWSDGTIKHAIVSFTASVTASGSITIGFQNMPTSSSLSGLDKTGILARNWDAQIEATGPSTQIANARQIVNDWNGTAGDKRVQYWLGGSYCTQIILEDRSSAFTYDLGWDSFKPLHPIFVVTIYPGYTAGVKVELILENAWTTKLEDQAYSLNLKTGFPTLASVYTKSTFTHIARSRWRKNFWSGTAPAAYKIDHNLAYLAYSKALPNFDTSVIVSSSAVTNDITAFNASDKGDIAGHGQWEQSMPSTGARPDIGLLPAWYARYIYDMSNVSMVSLVAGNAEVAGYVPIHYRESSTTKFFDTGATVNAFGYPLSLNARGTIWTNDLTHSGTAAGDKITPVGTATTAGWTWEVAHEPGMVYLPYLLTGDWYFLEEMYFWAANALGSSAPGFSSYQRGDKFGYANRNVQTRGQAWVLRDIGQAAFMAPDGSSERAYFLAMVNNNLQIEEGQQGVLNGTFPPVDSACPGYSPGPSADKWCFGKLTVGQSLSNPLHFLSFGDDSAGCAAGEPTLVQPPDANATNPCDSPWMIGYKLNVMGHLQELGFGTGPLNAQIFKHLLNSVLTASNAYRCCGYRIPVAHTNGQFFANWTDAINAFSTSYDDCGTTRNLRTFMGFVDACGGTSDANVSAPGYPHIIKGAASYLKGFGITDGALTGTAGWDWFATHVCCQTSTGANPQWVVIPRISTGADLTAPGHGIGGQMTINISGATGSWTRLNGVTFVNPVDANTLTWYKQVGWLTNTGVTATVRLLFKAAHSLQAGDTITLMGYTSDTDLNAVYTVQSVPNPYSFTIMTTNVTDGDYCNDGWLSCTFTENNTRLVVSAGGFGALTGTVEFRTRTSTSTYCVYTVSGAGPLRLINNYMDCWFSSLFTGGGGAYTDNTATLTSATATGATFSSVNNLSVGDLVALQVTGNDGGTPFTAYKSVKIATIAGSVVTWTTYGSGGLPVNDTGTVSTSGTTVTWVSGVHFGCQEANVGVSGGRVIRGMTIRINSVDYTIASCPSATQVTLTTSAGTQTGVAYSIQAVPDAPGLARWEGVFVGKGSVVRRNTFDKPINLAFSGTCKAYHELKVINRALFDGNQYTGEPCIAFGHPNYNQNGNTPWNRHRDGRFTNNLMTSGERFLVTSMDDPYETTPFRDLAKGSSGIVIENNLSVGHLPFWRPLSAIGGMDSGSRLSHNTFAAAGANGSWGLQIGCATLDWAPYDTTPFNQTKMVIRDNITFYGPYGIPIASGGSTCLDKTNSQQNVFIDTDAIGSGAIAADWPTNQYAATTAAVGYVGTCDVANWRNCKLASGSSFVSTATDGGDPGADVEAIEDHINGWSEQAGLIDYWAGEYRADAYDRGSTRAALHFNLASPIGSCSFFLYTNKSRRTLHGDTNSSGLQACNRTGNIVNGRGVAFVLGGNTALTAGTVYYYKLVDGSRTMVGEFKTRAAGSLARKVGVQHSPTQTLDHSANADMSSATTLSTATSHTFDVSAGAVRYWRLGSAGPVHVVVAP